MSDPVKEQLDAHSRLLEQHAEELGDHRERLTEVETHVENLKSMVKDFREVLGKHSGEFEKVHGEINNIKLVISNGFGELKLAINQTLHKALDSVPLAFAKRRDVWLTVGILFATVLGAYAAWHGH